MDQVKERGFIRFRFERKNLTTGDVGRICNVSQQTVIRCCETKTLTYYRVPGSRFRRVKPEDLRKFMVEEKIPLEKWEDIFNPRIVVVTDYEKTRDIRALMTDRKPARLEFCSSGFEIGFISASSPPACVILDLQIVQHAASKLAEIFRARPNWDHVVLIGLTNEEFGTQNGFDYTFDRTHELFELTDFINGE